jgi:CBS domain-containing protein
MADQVKDIMSVDPTTLDADSPVLDAARRMARDDIGAVIVEDGGEVCGIVTDRDIVVRAVATGKNLAQTPLKDICSKGVFMLSPEDDLDEAVKLMREKAVRRVPVVSKGTVVGILSLGDLAQERDRQSVLGQISAAPPTH